MDTKEQQISDVLAIVTEHRHEVEEPGISITDAWIDIPLKGFPIVRVEFQREDIFIHRKGRLTYIEFFDMCEEDCNDIGFKTGSFYSLVVPMIRKVIAYAEKMYKPCAKQTPNVEADLVYIGPMRRSCEVQIQCETPRPGFVLGFSIDHDTYTPEEGCEAPGHFPVAVVEYEDGRLSSVPVRFIRMTDRVKAK